MLLSVEILLNADGSLLCEINVCWWDGTDKWSDSANIAWSTWNHITLLVWWL